MKIESIIKSCEQPVPYKEYRYKQGVLYTHIGSGVVVLCTTSADGLSGTCVKGGTGSNGRNLQVHFIGEVRTDWNITFGEFNGCLELKQTL